MNAKSFLLLALAASVVLNVALLVRKPAGSGAAAPAPVSPPLAVLKPAAGSSVSGQATNSGATTPRVERPFDWRQVESDDYKKYIANLRAIGCPEETIRDIITADVNKLFADRKKALSATSTNKFQYWKGGMQMFAQAFDEQKVKQQQELAREKRALLTDLLGSAPEEKPDLASAAAMGGANILEQMLDFLPETKQTAVLEVIQKYQARMMKSMGGGAFDADSMKDLLKVQKEMEAELARTLTPQEIEDYNLRMSNTANMMRFTLASFEPSEQEFRDVFKVKKAFDDEFGPFGIPPTDKADKEKYDAAKKAMEGQLKQTLGDRYADYERAQDFSYQSLYSVAQRNGVSKEATIAAYDMKKAAEEQAKRVRGDKSLTADQRTAALQGIQSETQNSLRSTLGEKAFESYQKNPGAYWLKNLAPQAKKP